MANLQIKGIDNDIYDHLKALAATEHRSVSQQVLFLVRAYLAGTNHSNSIKTPAEVLLELSGSWEGSRGPEEIKENVMVIKKLKDVPFANLQGYENVKKKIVIGPDDGSKEIVLRYFSLKPGGKSPHHSHDFPHLVKIEAGNGIMTDAMGNDHPLQPGDYVYVNDNETHQFRNAGSGPFDFICIVPQRGEV